MLSCHHIQGYKGRTSLRGDDSITVHTLAGLNGVPQKISASGGNRSSNNFLFSSPEPTVPLLKNNGIESYPAGPRHEEKVALIGSFIKQKFSRIQRCFRF